jgi:NAD(P)-dependent dehydrogenase (short-subunit alcohol dehydrogenase family)
MPNVLIAGIDSALGKQIKQSLSSNGWSVWGTTRRRSNVTHNNFFCNFESSDSIDKCVNKLSLKIKTLDLLIISIGTLEPIGIFRTIDFDSWEKNFYVNFTGPLRFIRLLIPKMLKVKSPLVITFAGGGINSATTNYSSYTLSKIALTKAMELLATEEPKIRFISLGTGWIDTPIHSQTLKAGMNAGAKLYETIRRYSDNDFNDISEVSKFIAWIYDQNLEAISGRNFSLKFDSWGSENLIEKLLLDKDMFKLRRHGNEKI